MLFRSESHFLFSVGFSSLVKKMSRKQFTRNFGIESSLHHLLKRKLRLVLLRRLWNGKKIIVCVALDSKSQQFQ